MADRIPKSYFAGKICVDWGDVRKAHLIFLFPVQDIIDFAQSTDIDVFTRPHEHFRGWHDKRQGWFARVLACDPYCNRDVVRGLAIGYGQEAMHAEQELSATVVISYGSVREEMKIGLDNEL
jgi:hypothetical protein